MSGPRVWSAAEMANPAIRASSPMPSVPATEIIAAASAGAAPINR
ncbi:hypothetical protein ACWCPK_38430 [Streptomyces sp. NPDC001953]